MTEFFDFYDRLVRSWQEMVDVHNASVATISARLPMIAAAASGFGSNQERHETRAMVSEKLQAAAEGVHAGAVATANAAWKVMWGEAAPVAMAGHMMDVADAATQPARTKVHANAHRLGKRSS